MSSVRRKELFDAFIKYNEDFKKNCNLEVLHQWVNGSYVTKKAKPGDIDLVTFLDYRIIQ